MRYKHKNDMVEAFSWIWGISALIMMGEHLLAKEYLRFIERVHQVYPKLTKDDMLIVLLMRMRLRNTEIVRLLHVKPASFRLRRWRLKKKLEGLGRDLRSIIMKL